MLPKNKKKLSILIPVYNEIEFLELFTSKLLNVFKNINTEYIFIDDGSNDGSKEWLINFVNGFKNCNMRLYGSWI